MCVQSTQLGGGEEEGGDPRKEDRGAIGGLQPEAGRGAAPVRAAEAAVQDGLQRAAVRRDTAEHVRHVALARGAEDPHVLGRIRKRDFPVCDRNRI